MSLAMELGDRKVNIMLLYVTLMTDDALLWGSYFEITENDDKEYCLCLFASEKLYV